MSEPLAITERRGAVRFSVRVVPRASQSRVDGLLGAALRVRLAAPPVDGAANDELIRVLSATIGVRKSSVRIVSGDTSRSKIVEIDGVDAVTLRQKIERP